MCNYRIRHELPGALKATVKSVGVDGDSGARGVRVTCIKLKKQLEWLRGVAGSFHA